MLEIWHWGGVLVIRSFLHNFMTGRYGPDHLSIAMVVASLVLSLPGAILGYAPVQIFSYIVFAMALFRMLSRNVLRRRAENDKFIRYWWPIRTKVNRTFANFKHRKTHRFIKCRSCINTLRVPRGKGKLQITCPRCGERFIKKT